MSDSDMTGLRICCVELDLEEDLPALTFEDFRLLPLDSERADDGGASCTKYASLAPVESGCALLLTFGSLVWSETTCRASGRDIWWVIVVASFP